MLAPLRNKSQVSKSKREIAAIPFLIQTSHSHVQLSPCRITAMILSFTRLGKTQLCLANAMCKAFLTLQDVRETLFPAYKPPKTQSCCFSAHLLLPLKDRILGVSCNLYENVMLSSSFIYVMQSQYSPLQNLKHTQ